MIAPSIGVQDFFSYELSPGRGWAPFFDKGMWIADPEWGENMCEFINSEEDLRAVYFGVRELPDIDFTTQTLVIGRQERHVDGVDSLQLMSSAAGYELLVSAHVQKGLAPFNPVLEHFYFWGLYPKLEQKALSVSVSIRETENTSTVVDNPLAGEWYIERYTKWLNVINISQGEFTVEFRNDGLATVVNNRNISFFPSTGIYPCSFESHMPFGTVYIGETLFNWYLLHANVLLLDFGTAAADGEEFRLRRVEK